jgi:hypothetical protein
MKYELSPQYLLLYDRRRKVGLKPVLKGITGDLLAQ